MFAVSDASAQNATSPLCWRRFIKDDISLLAPPDFTFGPFYSGGFRVQHFSFPPESAPFLSCNAPRFIPFYLFFDVTAVKKCLFLCSLLVESVASLASRL